MKSTQLNAMQAVTRAASPSCTRRHLIAILAGQPQSLLFVQHDGATTAESATACGLKGAVAEHEEKLAVRALLLGLVFPE